MADIKISQLSDITTVNDSNVMPIVSNGVTMKVSAEKLKDYTIGSTDNSDLGADVSAQIKALNNNKQNKSLSNPIEGQSTIEEALEEIDSVKASKALFAPYDIPITLNDMSAYSSNIGQIKCTQIGRLLIVHHSLNFIGSSTPLPANTVINNTSIPTGLTANIGLIFTGNNGTHYRFILTTAGKIFCTSQIEQGVTGVTIEGDFIVPSAGWI